MGTKIPFSARHVCNMAYTTIYQDTRVRLMMSQPFRHHSTLIYLKKIKEVEKK
jgi:hypothetical protein